MVSTKIFAILGAIAAATFASADSEFEAFKAAAVKNADKEVWSRVQKDLDDLFPGVKCSLGPMGNTTATTTNVTMTPPKYAGSGPECKAIENGLLHLFPTIKCDGEVAWDKLQAKLEKLENKQKATRQLKTRQAKNRGHVDESKRRSIAEIAKKEHETITSCNRANRPGNCKICAAGYTAAAVAAVGVCAAAAYAASAATAGVLAGPAWIAFGACSTAAIGDLFASLTGCWGR